MKKVLTLLIAFSLLFALTSCSFFETSNNDDNQTDKDKTEEKLNYDLSNISFEDLTVTYDGKEHSITLNGDLPDGLTVTYENNKQTEAGTYKVVAKFTNSNEKYNDVSDMTATLTINKADYDLTGITFESKAFFYDGTSHEVTLTGELPEGLTVTYENNQQTEVGTYNVVAKFTNSNANYNDVSDMKATLQIVEEENLTIALEDQTFEYDGESHSLVLTGLLPEGIEAVWSGNEATNVGEYQVSVSFTGTDKLEPLTATLTIVKGTYDMSGVTFTNKNVLYDGNKQYLYITGDLPKGVAVEYENNGNTEIGEYEVVANFYGDPNNYNEIPSLKATLTITEAPQPSTELGEDVYYIVQSGEYTVTGTYSQIRVNVPEDDTETVKIYLNNVTVENDKEAPIYILQADKVVLNVVEGTTNYVYDKRTSSTEEDQVGSAAIYAECDLNLAGKGTLVVESTYNNGIHTKDDLQIKNVTLQVKAPNNAIKGNDSVTILSGNLTVISTSGDGIKTTNSDVSSKGNQRGSVTISGGTIKVYAACDGIDAAYDVVIDDSSVNLEIYTATYSSYTGEVHQSTDSTKTYYIAMSSSYSNYRYALYLYDNDGNYTWVNSAYAGSSGGRTRYYYYSVEVSSKYTNYKVYAFSSSQSTNSTDTYVACSGGNTINTANNCIMVSAVNTSSKSITTSWTSVTTSGSNGSSEYSTKGIKADNEIIISAGTILVKAKDDGIHANSDVTLENGSKGTGNVTISGGNITVTSGDDGIHADGTLLIEDGTISSDAYEGLEGNYITINGGTITVKGSDDGVNASKAITVNGGYLDVTVGSGDVDGIDSNGTYTQTGGYVISRISTNDTSGNMAALDCDSTITFKGGTFIALGTTASNFTTTIPYIKWGTSGMGMGGGRPGGSQFGGGSTGSQSTSSGSISISSGTYTVSNTNIEFTAASSYSALFVVSDQMTSGTSYTVYKGSSSVATATATK